MAKIIREYDTPATPSKYSIKHLDKTCSNYKQKILSANNMKNKIPCFSDHVQRNYQMYPLWNLNQIIHTLYKVISKAKERTVYLAPVNLAELILKSLRMEKLLICEVYKQCQIITYSSNYTYITSSSRNQDQISTAQTNK